MTADHPVRPFLLRMADYLQRRDSEHDAAWATMIRGLVAEHAVTTVFGFPYRRYLPSADLGDAQGWHEWDWVSPCEDCKTACTACSGYSGSDEHCPMPHPCPTLLEVASVFSYHEGFDPSWLPPRAAIPGETVTVPKELT